MQLPGVTFIVYADLHADIMHDSVARMEVMLREAKRYRVNFILHLGDIMYPDTDFLAEHAPEGLERRKGISNFRDGNFRDDEKREILAMIQKSGIPGYGALGNHDMDVCDKTAACRYYGLPGRYYSFDRGGVRFIALDSNSVRDGDRFTDYSYGNYFDYTWREINWIDPVQLAWLEEQIMTSPFPCVLLSHAPIGDEPMRDNPNIQNSGEIFALIRRANRERRRVILAMNGHMHYDGVRLHEGVPFWDVNSMSNQWLGFEYATVRYSETIHRNYPALCATAPYWDALFARVTIDSEGIRITGRESDFVGPSPQALGRPAAASFHPLSPIIASRFLSLERMP